MLFLFVLSVKLTLYIDPREVKWVNKSKINGTLLELPCKGEN